MDSVFLPIFGWTDSMDTLVSCLVSLLEMATVSAPTTGIANAEVSASIENFKTVIQRLIGELQTAANELKLRVEALRMGMQTCQDTLNQSIEKIRTVGKCTLKQLYVLANQIRNCTFRALTASKSEVAIIQDGISDTYLELHNIHMRMAHCTLMNPKNAVPCIEVLTTELPDIIDSVRADIPGADVAKTLEGINRCSTKISQNVDTMCA